MAADKIATLLVAIAETKKYRAGEYRGSLANTSINYKQCDVAAPDGPGNVEWAAHV
ncbi:hypothetical protein KGM_212936 [Danaus plexippus plexippus]|uniref:Uncharacterized protein n=1 Tax=Danaus plexippus plexippus TaxID=278856 RepID=A0A212ELV7_DANPL|nr:hypothetical protein KGM_212936 [Danaus plexippus plexippus]